MSQQSMTMTRTWYNEDVETEEEDENHVQDDQIANKRKRKIQQVVSISLRGTAINWMITDADQKGEQGLVLRTIAKFPSEFRQNYRPIIPKPQGGGRCAVKLVNMAVRIQSRYQQSCHQCERGSISRLLLAEDEADLNGCPTYTSSCCPTLCGSRPLRSDSLQL